MSGGPRGAVPFDPEDARDPADVAFAAGLARVLDPAGFALLETLPPYREQDALALGATLRQAGHDPELVAAVLTQSRLRERGAEKFGEFAAHMLLTPDGLEQATRLTIAALHARRFRDVGITSVADLGCGIGGDAMAMAALGLDVIAVDRDPVAVAVATVNLMPFPGARAELGDAAAHDVTRTEGIWLDPARRTTRGPRRRIHDAAEISPSLETISDLARRLGEARDGTVDAEGTTGAGVGDGAVGAKLAPGIPHEALPVGTETQWLSWHGRVLEATCWFGPLRGPADRTALVIDDQGAHLLTPADRAPAPDPHPGPLADYLYEPDGAVIRAGLIGELAERIDGSTLDPSIAYLTSSRAVSTPFARGYAVRDVMPFGLKRLGTYLREHRIGRVEIKKRGTAVEPEELRRRLRPRRFGDEQATLVLTRIGGEQSIIVASPLPSDPPPASPSASVAASTPDATA